MKVSVLISLILICFVIILPISLAQESSPPVPAPSPVDYTLPYPGLLPDHPLYIIKSLRDKLLSVLIFDPIRKIEFYQLMTDKHINTAIFLVEKNKTSQALNTLKQARIFFKETTTLVNQLPPTKADQIGNTKIRFQKSLLKYIEVLSQLVANFSADEQKEVASMLDEFKKASLEFEKQ